MADIAVGAADSIARLSIGHDDNMPAPPRPSPLTSRGIVAVDITDKFAQAVKTMQPGEIVKDGHFTLFEAVAALEIMDPKMDSGCVKPGDEFDELYDVSQPLAPEEVVGIMDQLLCHEMSWHLGYPLSQTLFTSVYVESLLMPDPANIDEAHFVRDPSKTKCRKDSMLLILRAYCLGMLKACGYVNERVRSEHYYEEEDFVTNTYNRTLLANISLHDVREAISQAKRLLFEQSKYSMDYVFPLMYRLELREHFLSAAETPQQLDDPEKAERSWLNALYSIDKVKSSHESASRAVPEAFSEKLQRKLASTMPPRSMVQMNFDDACGHLERLFRDGAEMVDVVHYTDPQCLQTFVTTFQAKKPQPLVYVRTLLQTILFGDMRILGAYSIRQILDDDLSILVLPVSPLLDRANDDVEVIHDPRFVFATEMENFRLRARQPFLDVLRTACQNRCRVRRSLYHVVRAWDSLQVEAEEIDFSIQQVSGEQPVEGQFSLPLASWTYLYKLKMMEAIVQLGFELELYQTDELHSMYWYLENLSEHRTSHEQRIKKYLSKHLHFLASQPSPPPGSEAQMERAMNHIRLSILHSTATSEFSQALSYIYTVLHQLGLIVPPPRPYSDDEMRYQLRMKPFASIGLPEMPTLRDIEALQRSGLSVLVQLEMADDAIRKATRLFKNMSKLTPKEAFAVGCHDRWLAEIKSCCQATIAAGITVRGLEDAIQAAPAKDKVKEFLRLEVPLPSASYHHWWIVPKVSKIEQK